MMKVAKILIVLLLFSRVAFSQVYSSSAVARVNMIKPLSIVSIFDKVNFGEIFLTGSAFTRTLDPSNGAIFRVEGHPNRNVVISYNFTNLNNAQWVSQNGGTVGYLTYEPEVVHTGASSSYNLPKPVLNGSSYQLVNSNGIGVLYLWIGGKIYINANQPIGDYEGTINITISY